MLEDYTGLAPTHRITGEEIATTAISSENAFVLAKGAFYAESVIIRHKGTNQILSVGTDYKFKVLDAAATGHTGGKFVYTLIVLTSMPTAPLLVDYQFVGGKHIGQKESLDRLLDSEEILTSKEFYFSQIKNRPHSYDTTLDHLHDASDITGKDEEVAALAGIAASIDDLTRNIVKGDESEVVQDMIDLHKDTQLKHGVVVELSDVVEEQHDNVLVARDETVAAKNIVVDKVEEMHDVAEDIDELYSDAIEAWRYDLWYQEWTDVKDLTSFPIQHRGGVHLEVTLNGYELSTDDYNFDETELILEEPIRTDECILTVLSYGKNESYINYEEWTDVEGQTDFDFVYDSGRDFIKVHLNGFKLALKDYELLTNKVRLKEAIATSDAVLAITSISHNVIDGGYY